MMKHSAHTGVEALGSKRRWIREVTPPRVTRKRLRVDSAGQSEDEELTPELETPWVGSLWDVHNPKHVVFIIEDTIEKSRQLQSNADEPLDIATRLTNLFENVDEYRKILRCRGEQAQRLINLFQTLLDGAPLEPAVRRHLVVAMQRLSKESGLYPTCFGVDDVELVGEHPIAAGSFGDIYKGSLHGQHVCLKVIRIYQASRVEYLLKHFSQEAILWGQLSHPNLLPFYGLYRFRSRLCLVAPWMEHGDINGYLERENEANRILLASDIALGVEYLHTNDIIHGDLKGANILISGSGRACLADFGLSSITDPQILKWTSQSSAASKGGSVRWQAPELFDIESDKLVYNSKASDIYALSCVFYEVFTGNIPFVEHPRDSSVMLKIQSGIRPSRPTASHQSWDIWGLTEDLWELMEDCWIEDPAERPTIQEIITQLDEEGVEDGRPVESQELLSPARFRNSVGERAYIPDVYDLDNVLFDVDQGK